MFLTLLLQLEQMLLFIMAFLGWQKSLLRWGDMEQNMQNINFDAKYKSSKKNSKLWNE